jgi:putative tryptophan/tyrosine transport system substrate-binding protein
LAGRHRSAIPVVWYLVAGGPTPSFSIDAFFKGLGEMGFVMGRNVAFEFRGSEHYDQMRTLAAELVRRRVNVIYTGGNVESTLAAKDATTTIPIVFQNGDDPVALGLVASLNRPGGNITGVSNYSRLLAAKRLELLRELVPHTGLIGVINNPKSITSKSSLANLVEAAGSVRQEVFLFDASTATEIEVAFRTFAQRGVVALFINGDTFFLNQRHQLVELLARYKLPATFNTREFAEAGGLVSYGDDRSETRRQAGMYVGRILKGEKPADLPVLQPIKFELVINLKTAKALGLTIPETLLATADEVIQ